MKLGTILVVFGLEEFKIFHCDLVINISYQNVIFSIFKIYYGIQWYSRHRIFVFDQKFFPKLNKFLFK